MNRRGFIASLCAIPLAAYAATKAKAVSVYRGLTFKGVPVVFDKNTPSSTIYFIHGGEAFMCSRKTYDDYQRLLDPDSTCGIKPE